MALSSEERLRLLLGEPIPDGGVDTDTLFASDQVNDLLVQTGDNIDRSAYEGWRIKAAHFANLVDVTEGNAQRKMAQLHAHALEMVKIYGRSSSGPTEGRARVGRIVRTDEYQ